MKLESQVCSLELSKKLKELGVKQESLFYYRAWENPISNILNAEDVPSDAWCLFYRYEKYSKSCDFEISAFTVAELGTMLPAYTNIKGDAHTLELSKYYRPQTDNIHYSCEYWNLDKSAKAYLLGKGFYNISEANCRAKMLIYLGENSLIEVKDGSDS